MAAVNVEKISETWKYHRLDAKFYQPQYLINFSKGNWQPIKRFLDICQYGISQAMTEEPQGYPIFRMDDIKDCFLLDDEVKYLELPEKIFKQFRLEIDDILFNRVNAEEFVGRTGIFKLKGDYVFASYLIRLRVKANSEILPDYLNIFLNTKFGKKQIHRFSRRAVNQANVNAEELKNFKICIIPLETQKQICMLSNEAWNQIEISKSFYFQAENLLLEELGLKDFKPEEELSYVANLSKMKNVHRMDAEYFQPKYEKIFSYIKAPIKKLGEITKFLNHAKQPPYVDDGEIPIITQKHLGKAFLNLESINDQETKLTSVAWFKNYPSYQLKQGDVLYYSVGAYIGKTNIILEEDLKATAASFITIIRPKEEINSIYLTVILNSIVGQLQSEKWQSATAQQYIYPKDIKNFKIPILSKSVQQKIASLVQQSHEARKKAKELLEDAKRKVEEAIENEIKK